MPTPDYPRSFGPYVLLERLGQGGMSEVDLARRAVDDADYVRFLVIKRIHAQHAGDGSFIRMFHDEARINAELQHENIATVYDFGQEGDEFFLAMEYVPGCDLRHVQRIFAHRGEAFPLRIALAVVADVLAGLDYAHSRVDTYGHTMHIVHRDVNPRNIMLSVRGEVKLIDFGVAKADNRAEHTVGHSLKGKFAYMAPEQIDGARAIDGRADVFAVGIVLHELLTGASPFAGLSEVQIMHRILAGRIPAIVSTPSRPIPDAVINLHDKALATNADARFRSAGAMREAIVAAAAELGGLPRRVELAEFLRKVDPDTSTVSRRLKEWRAGSPGERSTSKVAVIPPPAQTSSSGTLATGTATAPRTPRLALAAVGGVAVGLVLLLGLAVGAWWSRSHRPGPERAPVEAAATPTPMMPSTAPSTTPSPAPSAASAVPSASPLPSPTTHTPPASPSPGAASTAGTAAHETAARETAAHETAARETAPTASPTSAAPPEAPPPPPLAPAAGSATARQSESAEAPPSPMAERGSGSEAGTSAGTAAPTALPAASPAASVDSASTAPTAIDGPTGFLNVSSRPTGLELRVDGQVVGRTPLRALTLSEGPHTLEVRDPASGQRWSRKVQVLSGRAQMIILGDEP